jgi:hypothetical protein
LSSGAFSRKIALVAAFAIWIQRQWPSRVFAMQHVELTHEEQIFEDVGGQILFGL